MRASVSARRTFMLPSISRSSLDRLRIRLVFFALAIGFASERLFAQSPQSGAAAGPERVTFSDSIAGIPPQPNQPSAATLVRNYLTQAESEAPMEFSVALKMRDLVDLRERLARNEVISPDEMATKYFPTEADYTRVARWLTANGIFGQAGGPGSVECFCERDRCANREVSWNEVRSC
jgi:hypothetical protein